MNERIGKMKDFQSLLLDFLDKEDQSEENYQKIVNFLSTYNLSENKRELKLFLTFIQKVFHNHHRSSNFYSNIFLVISIFLDDMKHNFSNSEIFNIFKDDKKLLLFLIEKKVFFIDNKIINKMKKGKYYNNQYPKYFGLIKSKGYDEESFIEKQKIGENDNYVCQLIRNNSIEKFVAYVNQENISIKDYIIKPSIFETNSFLLDNDPTLIEYAAFYGSIVIFRYLYMNGAELTPSLWEYAIHSNNAEMIHLLEELKVTPKDIKYNRIFEEAMKCHHNSIAQYIQNNKMENIDEKSVFLNSLKYYNYEFYPSEIKYDDRDLLFCACQYDHFFIIKEILSKTQVNVNSQIKCSYEKNTKRRSRRRDDDDDDDNEDNNETKIEPFIDDFTRWNDWREESRERDKIMNRRFWKSNIYKEELSLLHLAVENENVDIVKFLLINPEIDVNQKMTSYYDTKNSYNSEKLDINREEKTALHIAAEKGNLEIVELLCQNSKININEKTIDCYPSDDDTRERITPLHFAIDNEDSEIVAFLVENPKIDINLKTTFERWWNGGKEEYKEITPLCFAVEKGNLEICRIILSNMNVDVNKKLIEFYTTANLSYVHKRKDSPLNIAIENNYDDIAELLLENKSIDVNSLSIKEYRYYKYDRRKQMRSPLLMAIVNGNERIVNILLSNKKIDLNFGLLNIGGGSNLRDKRSIGNYDPRIRKDKERPRRREDHRRLVYLNYRKDNYNDDGTYNPGKHRMNIQKYREMNEEEDINDDLDYRYRIFVRKFPIEASFELGYEKLMILINNALRNHEKQEIEEEDLANDDSSRYDHPPRYHDFNDYDNVDDYDD